jgi:hypothetical protein
MAEWDVQFYDDVGIRRYSVLRIFHVVPSPPSHGL